MSGKVFLLLVVITGVFGGIMSGAIYVPGLNELTYRSYALDANTACDAAKESYRGAYFNDDPTQVRCTCQDTLYRSNELTMIEVTVEDDSGSKSVETVFEEDGSWYSDSNHPPLEDVPNDVWQGGKCMTQFDQFSP